jgi:hypothetical protein
VTEYGALTDRMTRVETKLDMLIAQLGLGHQDHEARIRALEQRVDPTHVDVDHENRLRRLERVMWWAAGVAAAGGGGVGALLVSLLGGGGAP